MFGCCSYGARRSAAICFKQHNERKEGKKLKKKKLSGSVSFTSIFIPIPNRYKWLLILSTYYFHYCYYFVLRSHLSVECFYPFQQQFKQRAFISQTPLFLLSFYLYLFVFIFAGVFLLFFSIIFFNGLKVNENLLVCVSCYMQFYNEMD